MAKLIKETTKSERENYLNKLFACKNGDCENCGVCKIFAGTSPQEVYYDYIIENVNFWRLVKLLIVANKIQCLLTDCKLLKHCIFICNPNKLLKLEVF